MNATLYALVSSFVETATSNATTRGRTVVKAQGQMLLNACAMKEIKQNPPKAAKPRGAPKATFSIGVDNEGTCHIQGIPAVARLLGCSPNTVSTKLSLGNGKFHFLRTSPLTGNPVDCVVMRGEVYEHNERVITWLERTNPKLPKPPRPTPVPGQSRLSGRRAGTAFNDD